MKYSFFALAGSFVLLLITTSGFAADRHDSTGSESEPLSQATVILAQNRSRRGGRSFRNGRFRGNNFGRSYSRGFHGFDRHSRLGGYSRYGGSYGYYDGYRHHGFNHNRFRHGSFRGHNNRLRGNRRFR